MWRMTFPVYLQCSPRCYPLFYGMSMLKRMARPWKDSSTHYHFIFLLKLVIPFSYKCNLIDAMGLPRWLSGKKSTCQCRRHKICGFNPWASKIPWRRVWQPTPVFLSGEFHGQRSLAGYSPWGCKERNTTEQVRSNWNCKLLPWGFQPLYRNKCGFFFFWGGCWGVGGR